MSRYQGSVSTASKSMMSSTFTYSFALLLYSISWFCLWNISRYLTYDTLLAALLLPTGLKLVVLALTPRRLCLSLMVAESLLLLLTLNALNADTHEYWILLTPSYGYLLSLPFRHLWTPLSVYWQKLLALVGLGLVYGLSCGLGVLLWVKPFDLPAFYAVEALLSAITGGLLLMPFLFLTYDYLVKQIWQPLSPSLVHQEVTLRTSALIWCVIFFAIGLIAELTLLEQMAPLALLLFLLPNIFMAYRYGWQGGVLASMMNSILLATARQVTGSFDSDLELQTFIATQALIGLGLGIAISRQHLLARQLHQTNARLETELAEKQRLARQLIKVEESTRKAIARELHDEIGQNITAIQIQSMLAKKLTKEKPVQDIADTTHGLAMRIHASTRSLLSQLRPPALDTMGLEQAIRQLSQELGFRERGIDFHLNFGIFPEKMDDITRVTLYRIIQELLNNVCKHAKASEVHLSMVPGDTFSVEMRDNGIGLKGDWRTRGHGLRGIEERVSALGGQVAVSTFGQGTRVTVNLPTKISISPQK